MNLDPNQEGVAEQPPGAPNLAGTQREANQVPSLPLNLPRAAAGLGDLVAEYPGGSHQNTANWIVTPLLVLLLFGFLATIVFSQGTDLTGTLMWAVFTVLLV